MISSKSGLWTERWKLIRPFVAFKLNPRKGLSDYQKRKLRKYAKAIQVLNGARIAFPYMTRSKRDLTIAQKYAQHPRGLTELRVAFIPTVLGGAPKVTFKGKGKKRRVVVEDQNGMVERHTFQFSDYEDYAGQAFDLEKGDDGRTGIEKVAERIAAAGADEGVKQFKSICGEHEEISGERPADFLAETMEEYVQTYADHDKWFNGFIGYKFQRQESFKEYKRRRGLSRRNKSKRAQRGRKEL